MNVLQTVKTGLSIAKGWTVKHSPEILLGTSIAAGIGATVSGCIAVKKMEKVNQKHKEALDILHRDYEGKEETPEYRRSVTKEYGRYGLDIVKTWSPCVGFTALSITTAMGSFKIINGRLIKAEMAFTGLSKFIEQYRDNVIEDQGEEKDLYYATNGALKKKAELQAAGKYKEKDHKPGELVKKQEDIIIRKADNSVFHYDFFEDNVKWSRYSSTPYYNYTLLCEAETLFQHKLEDNGMLLLDDVYNYLGLDMSKLHAERAEGRTYGWTLDMYAEHGMPNDNRVSFGVLEYNDTQHKLFRNGDITDVTLHFNCRLLTKETNQLLANDVEAIYKLPGKC